MISLQLYCLLSLVPVLLLSPSSEFSFWLLYFSILKLPVSPSIFCFSAETAYLFNFSSVCNCSLKHFMIFILKYFHFPIFVLAADDYIFHSSQYFPDSLLLTGSLTFWILCYRFWLLFKALCCWPEKESELFSHTAFADGHWPRGRDISLLWWDVCLPFLLLFLLFGVTGWFSSFSSSLGTFQGF